MQTDTDTPAQPWEGISGTVRDTDDLLSLEDAAMPRRRMMIAMALCLRRATLVGKPAPVVQRMSERIENPQPGDFVVELTMARRADSEYRGLGIMLARRREWASTDEDWAREMADEPEWLRGNDNRCTDDAWYIQYGPAERDIARWTNCDFMAVPGDDRAFDLPIGFDLPPGYRA